MTDREKVIKGLSCCAKWMAKNDIDACNSCPYHSNYNDNDDYDCIEDVNNEAVALLKEQEAMNVDAFVQWCIDSHIMGDATVRGVKYWVGKYKEIKEGR